MRTLTIVLVVLVGLAGLAWGEAREGHSAGKPATIPDNRHDPEDRGDSASSGASSRAESLPGAPTDLGKEAEKEEDAYRPKARARLPGAPQATKPRVRNLK